MALQYPKDQFGVTFDDAYLMIKSLRFNKESFNLEVIVSIYPDQACRNSNTDCLETKRYNINTENLGFDFYQIAYNFLKQQEEYSSSIDILE